MCSWTTSTHVLVKFLNFVMQWSYDFEPKFFKMIQFEFSRQKYYSLRSHILMMALDKLSPVSLLDTPILDIREKWW